MKTPLELYQTTPEEVSHRVADLEDDAPTAVLILDTAALLQHYAMVEYADTAYGGGALTDQDEEEVVPLTDAIAPLNKFLVSVQVTERDARLAVDPEILEFALDWPLIQAGSTREIALRVEHVLSLPIINRPI